MLGAVELINGNVPPRDGDDDCAREGKAIGCEVFMPGIIPSELVSSILENKSKSVSKVNNLLVPHWRGK